jgi:hypothetical protein
MKAWLGRSGDCPLFLSLESAPEFPSLPHTADSAQDLSLFLQALMPFAPRWREINFKAQAPMLAEALSNLAESDVPNLRDLRIFEHPGETSSPNWASVRILRGPELSKFSLLAGNLNLTDLPLRWSQLTSLSLEDLVWNSPTTLTSDTALQILSQCPELRICHLTVLDMDDWNGESPVIGSIVQCPLLHTLHLVCRGVPAFTLLHMFCRLSLPELRQFQLRGYSSSESQSIASFSSFLEASTRLESLDISTDTFSKVSLVGLLRRLPPSIQRLKIIYTWVPPGTDITFDDDILAILTPSHDLPSPCCPTLRELIIRHSIAVSDVALLRFITARMTAESCTPLERVDASFGREMQIDILPSLRQFTDAGFRIGLKYPPSRPSCFSPWLGLNPHSDAEPYFVST